ncbi:hypothetical protein GCM10009665_34400 [Kitasatospora nipponensis]|uniref:F5/8 type C domain-containing protein n=1 Tax=Kitasatospora nipponensis TaxID=258049 RepID=A0ABN1W917_9ACTN
MKRFLTAALALGLALTAGALAPNGAPTAAAAAPGALTQPAATDLRTDVTTPAAAATGTQPYASSWFPSTLLTWDPATDPDAAFNRSHVPLQPRSSDPVLRANPNAQAGAGGITSLVSFGPTSNNPSQGSAGPNYYAFSHWQYLDKLVFWGGSASEGIILAPNATVIDAAHRNGVKVYGNVFFPPTAYGGQLQWVQQFLQKSGSTYPVADKLDQVAQYYGFDGWFINQETDGGNTALATSMRDLIRYAHSRAPGTELMWYDAMTTDGSVNWQNELDGSNDAFLQENGSRVADSMFLNFGWSTGQLASSAADARRLGRSPYDLYAGVDTEANGSATAVNWSALYPAGQPHTTSLGLYRPEWTFNSASDRADYYARESRFWDGPTGDPSTAPTADAWPGLAAYQAESTPVTGKPFVTSFNTGQGDRSFVDGQVMATGGWNNLGLQDVLPTYRWLVSPAGSGLTPSLDFTDAYNGGSSLLLTGTLNSPATVRLYQSRVPVGATTRLDLTLKTPAAGATHLSAALSFTDAPTTFTHLDLGSTTGTGWETRSLDLSAFAGRTIAQIGLYAAGPVGNYTVHVGQLALYDAPATVAAPSAVTVLGSTDTAAGTKSLRLGWQAPASASASAVHHYNVYQRDADGSRRYLGGTDGTAYFVPALTRAGTDAATTVEVEAVSATFQRSAVATTTVTWSGTGQPGNLALGRTATGSTPCNAAEGPAKAVNGSVTGGTSDKFCTLAASKYLQVDLGAVHRVSGFTVRHAGAGGENPAWDTRAFTIQLSTDGTTWSTPVKVTANTADVSTHAITAGSARYARLNITTPTQNGDPAARIYEFEVYGT